MQNQGKFSDPEVTLGQGSQLPDLPDPSPPFTKFNDFPPEIQRWIFELAYRLTEDCGGQSDKLVLVSRKVRAWIEPLLYESAIISMNFGWGDRRFGLYIETFRSRPKEFYSRSVKRVHTSNVLKNSSDFELELLQVCDSLVSLGCWSDPREELANILKTKIWPNLKFLCINIDILPRDENTFHLPLFQNLIHLEVASKDSNLPSWESLKALHKLTHMRVHMSVTALWSNPDGRLMMDLVYAIATEARKCFPLNLKSFIILLPGNALPYLRSKEYTTSEDKKRRDRLESIQLRTFDPRIVVSQPSRDF